MSNIDELIKRRNEAERDYLELECRLNVLRQLKANTNEHADRAIAKLEAEKKLAQRIFESLDEQICEMAY